MIIFWILAAGLAGLAVLFAVAPLLTPAPTAQDAPDSDDTEADQALLNLELFKQQLTELDADLSSGKLDQTVYEAARRDLERELLHDLGDRDPLTAARSIDAKQRRYRLPGPRPTALALLLVVPLAAWVLYGLIGSQALIPQLEQLAASGGAGSSGGHGGGQAELPPLEELVARLEQRLEQEPGNAEGWMMLGRTYFATGDRKRAQAALAQAYKLLPTDPLIVLAYAESIATNNDNQLEGRPAELISEALALEPNNATARWLAAMVAFQRGQFQSAATTWRNLLEQLDPESEDAAELRNLISEAEQRAGLPDAAQQIAQAGGVSVPVTAAAEAAGDNASDDASQGSPRQASSGDEVSQGSAAQVHNDPGNEPGNDPGPSNGPATSSQPSARASAGADAQDRPSDTPPEAIQPGVQVSVALATELSGRLPPNTPVFIYAKAAAGPPMPLAVQRATLGDLPVQVRLDDSMAMMPAMQLSNFPQIIVGARVSPSGQAMPRPGDLQGETGPVESTATEPVQVRINQVLR
ncbi:c-type cytochrome biogenesis protein CcmI [Halochromatium roseum]|uniref:c-type cytochrome biogenesis protein CcmI n=1 Tax=Halochromatium roseum TaxID=391920 RepID=UPI001912D051|nr:c-type cytochrome biogenesis protein CcmI [Halochromatium roseum]MBK5939903.1 c-type cytochrome biogenesis protein CcmI [Halochromatium roseum]